MPVYKREGVDPAEAWNEVIRQVNTLAEECDLEPLDLANPDHIWNVTDIETVHEKLIEVCEDNSFSSIDPIWKESTVNEIITAIENGSCCEDCEDADLDEIDSDEVDRIVRIEDGVSLLDWAGWIMQPVAALTTITPEEGDPYTEGGWGWIGRQYSTWEIWLGGDPQLVASGSIVDGYIQITGFSTNTGGTFSGPSPDPNPLPNADWTFPYEFAQEIIQEGTPPPDPIPQILENRAVDALGAIVWTETVQDFPEGDPGGDPIVDNPFTFDAGTFLYGNAASPFYAIAPNGSRGFLRIICS